MDLNALLPSLLGGLAGGAGTLFALARRLVTREEVERMIQERLAPAEDRMERLEKLTEEVRKELVELRIATTRLSVLLEAHE